MKKALLTFALAGCLSAQSLSTIHNVSAAQFRMFKPAASKKGAITTAAVLGTAAALYFTADKPTAGYFRANAIGGGTATKYAMIATPAVIYGLGLLHHDSYTRDTAIYAAVAAVEAQGLTLLAKHAASRVSPNGTPNAGVFASSHTAVAFAVASVIAHRTHNKWVKVAAYTGAAAIGVSTIAQNGHYPSDVAIGAGIGYFTGRAF